MSALIYNRRPFIIAHLTVLILGGGPAGSVTAIGLSRLGYQVTVVASHRTFAACEGLSERTLSGLRKAGCLCAAETVMSPSPRRVSWNGHTNQYNTEQLVFRPRFDAKLTEDLKTAGVTFVRGLAQTIENTGQGWQVQITDTCAQQTLECDFLVEARGRAAPLKAKSRIRGPETVSLLQRWQITTPNQQTGSMVLSDKAGWVWLARVGDELYTQLTLSAKDPKLPKKGGLKDFMSVELDKLPEVRQWIESAVAISNPIARNSTTVFAGDLVGERMLRVGDAALAVDPLSGNGIFQALSSGLVAPATINTLLLHPERAKLAAQFYQERCYQAFMRFARIGRDFYSLEQRWSQEPFWQQRSLWPDLEPVHSKLDIRQIRVVNRPVVSQDQIVEKSVVVTPDQPLGIWHVAGIELSPLINDLLQQPTRSKEWVHARLSENNLHSQLQKAAVLNWLLENRLIENALD